jgi:very-short-patch-repair endonuclease
MKANQWYGRRFSQWIEVSLRKKFGDEWMLENPPANFEVLQKYAQTHKVTCTDFEYQIANRLRANGLPIDHQVIYFNRYIADLALVPARTIIEIDGIYHDHSYQKSKDQNRDKVFDSFGFDVHRIKMNLSPEDLKFELQCFARQYQRHARGYRLKPLTRPVSIEKISANGMIQKALALKSRKK